MKRGAFCARRKKNIKESDASENANRQKGKSILLPNKKGIIIVWPSIRVRGNGEKIGDFSWRITKLVGISKFISQRISFLEIYEVCLMQRESVKY